MSAKLFLVPKGIAPDDPLITGELYAPAQPPLDVPVESARKHICDNCPNVLDDCYPESETHCFIRPVMIQIPQEELSSQGQTQK
jgi:hypothetical protein